MEGSQNAKVVVQFSNTKTYLSCFRPIRFAHTALTKREEERGERCLCDECGGG
jgi:hypothetical protein